MSHEHELRGKLRETEDALAAARRELKAETVKRKNMAGADPFESRSSTARKQATTTLSDILFAVHKGVFAVYK